MLEAGALGDLRPAQRLAALRASLTEDRERLLGGGRPGTLTCAAASSADGVCLVVPLEPADVGVPRAARTAAAAAGALALACGLPEPTTGDDQALEAATWGPWLALRAATPDGDVAAELLPDALAEHSGAVDRVRLALVLFGARELDDTEPIAVPWLWRAELAARLGAHPGAASLPAEIEDALVALAHTRPPQDAAADETAAHGDPVLERRVVRRILRRLDGMGKYGGYHTEISHLARGFAGHERAVAIDAGEALLRAGLLVEKPSVGQRHVSLVAARSADIQRLIATGETDDPALLAFFHRS